MSAQPAGKKKHAIDILGLRAVGCTENGVLRAVAGRDDGTIATAPDEYVHQFEQLLAMMGHTHITMVIDDAHMLDEPSVQFLVRVFRRASRPICLVLGLPPHRGEARSGLDELLQSRHSSRIELGPLTREESLELLTNALGHEPIADEWTEWCIKEAAGNPLHLLALARESTSQSRAEFERLGVHLVSGAFKAPGNGTEHAIQSGLERLPPHVREVLAGAAVIGTSFSTEQAAEIVQQPVRSVERALETARQTGVVASDTGGVWELSHVILVNMLRAWVPQNRRREFHRTRAEQLIRQPGASPIEVASHLKAGGQENEAVEYLMAHARSAAEIGAWREAASLFRRAAEGLSRKEVLSKLSEDDYEKVVIDPLFATAQFTEVAPWVEASLGDRRGTRRAALSTFGKALGRAVTRAIGKPKRLGEARDSIATPWNQLVQANHAYLRTMRKAVELAYMNSRPGTLFSLGWIHAGNAALFGDRQAKLVATSHLAIMLGGFGQELLAKQINESAGERARKLWTVEALAEQSLYSAMLFVGFGNYRAVDAAVETVSLLIPADQYSLVRERLMALRVYAAFMLGQYDTADDLREQTLVSAKASRNEQTHSWLLATELLIAALRGERVDRSREKLLQMHRTDFSVSDTLYAMGALIAYGGGVGQMETLERMEELLLENPVGAYFLTLPIDILVASLNELCLNEDDPTKYAELVRRNLRVILATLPGTLVSRPLRARLLLRLGDLAQIDGRYTLAKVVFSAVERVHQKMNVGHDDALLTALRADSTIESRREAVARVRYVYRAAGLAEWLERRIARFPSRV